MGQTTAKVVLSEKNRLVYCDFLVKPTNKQTKMFIYDR